MKFINRFHKVASRSPEELSDERRLTELLEEYRVETDEDQRKAMEKGQIIPLIDKYFRLSLRPVMAKLFGPQMLDHRPDLTMGFTQLMQDFFADVWKKQKGTIDQLQTARDLRNWSSTVLANRMRNYGRRKKLGQEIIDDVITPLYENNKKHFEKRFQDRFDDLHETLDEWKSGTDDTLRQYAKLLELHYLFGMTWEEAAADLGIGRSSYFRCRDAALAKLREELM